MFNSLILGSALIAAQGTYQMQPAPEPARRDPAATTTESPPPAPQPTVAAVPGKTLADLPNTNVRYFDVAGKNLNEINKSIEAQQRAVPNGAPAVAPMNWALKGTFTTSNLNGQCRVTSAKATFSANVAIPKLVKHRAHGEQFVAAWNAYIAGLENGHAAYLWFVRDRAAEVEKAMLASTCATAESAGAAAVQRVRTEATEFRRTLSPVARATQ